MGNMTLRNIPDDIHLKLKQRAAANKRSAEAELREILSHAVQLDERPGFGTRMVKKFSGSTDQDFEFERDKTPAEPMEMK